MILDISGVEFSYNSSPLLKNIDFTADSRELVAILGPNGVGKTTLLKCINRINDPDGGTIMVDSDNILDMSRKDMAKRIGYVPQRADVSGSTVFDSVLLGRKPHIEWDVTEKDITLTARVIHLMGLDRISDKKVGEISGGEYQLVQIARAIVQQPRTILLDEPTSNLDPSNQHMIMHVLQRIVRANGMTAIMVVHDLNLAVRHADKFILMKDGAIYAAGGKEVITSDNIRAVYNIDVYVEEMHGIPIVIPKPYEE